LGYTWLRLYQDLRFVAPNLASIDGEGQPAVFLAEVLPWQLQSPLMPSIGILMASATQALENGVEMAENPESLIVKARVLSYINKFLNMADTENFHLIASEALKCVINLVVMEVRCFLCLKVNSEKKYTHSIISGFGDQKRACELTREESRRCFDFEVDLRKSMILCSKPS
jgi:hypothetical protein